jgi:hypothetical protein
VLLKVVLLDHHVWPDEVHQFPLADELTGPFGERAQQIEGARAEAGRDAVNEHATLARLQFETAGEA